MRDPSELLADAKLAYVSDYFSFAGADEHGPVVFALDTNRGRDGDRFEAEHLYGVLHEGGLGWVHLEGVGRYRNERCELLSIPDSAAFKFLGTPAHGIVVASPSNGLTLAVEPLTERMRRDGVDRHFLLRSGAASLHWRGRRIPGRVIYEYLVGRGMNLMTRRSFSGLAGLEFLYLRTDEDEDLYLQLHHGPGALDGIEPLYGFSAGGTGTVQLERLAMGSTRHAFARGLYRWPTSWEARWNEPGGVGSAHLSIESAMDLGNWVLAGFRMAPVTGELKTSTKGTVGIHGLAEVLATAPPRLFRLVSRI